MQRRNTRVRTLVFIGFDVGAAINCRRATTPAAPCVRCIERNWRFVQSRLQQQKPRCRSGEFNIHAMRSGRTHWCLRCLYRFVLTTGELAHTMHTICPNETNAMWSVCSYLLTPLETVDNCIATCYARYFRLDCCSSVKSKHSSRHHSSPSPYVSDSTERQVFCNITSITGVFKYTRFTLYVQPNSFCICGRDCACQLIKILRARANK